MQKDRPPTPPTPPKPPSPDSMPLPLPSPLSEMEIRHYYDGIPSRPLLVARTSTTPWEEFTGPEEDKPYKDLRFAGNHPIKEVWSSGLADKIIALLRSTNVDYNDLDVVRMGINDLWFPDTIVWIGVRPGSLSGYDGLDVALKCKELIVEYGITDVEVEIREAIVLPSRSWPRW